MTTPHASPLTPREGGPKVAVIGGTGMNDWPGLEISASTVVDTPYGAPSAPLVRGQVAGIEAIFLARHGQGHKIPPHAINYRANMWALKNAGVEQVIAIGAVGAIAGWFAPGALAVPNDLIDYSWGREHTLFDGRPGSGLKHIEFNQPYAPSVRKALLDAAKAAGVDVRDGGVMAVTQGPRLESPGEIRRLKQDGCDMVGMTSMPEAGLATELALPYACLAVSVNWAPGIGSGDIHGQIEHWLALSMAKVRAILEKALPELGS
ncbi:S-methyl-5'-thioinosine phosphorylase [Nevskia sp.]|uniref:S-methyl-5'-thioinosine phosphorylase n=1 Tax=Nevskia sp. TaxID=1929292 RepID=UPI0025F78380|nr:S-methyl-5'-thioinosine phosphorylase [Nevskia sp.]